MLIGDFIEFDVTLLFEIADISKYHDRNLEEKQSISNTNDKYKFRGIVDMNCLILSTEKSQEELLDIQISN